MAYSNIEGLEKELLDMIIDICDRLPAMAESMESSSPLIGPDSLLDLDSLDAVEIVAAIQTRFGVRITSKETSVEVLNSLQTMAEYITAQREQIETH